MLSLEKDLKNLRKNKELSDIIRPIIRDEHFKELKIMRHHIFFNRYEHLINASTIAYKLAKIFKADVETCVLAAILHDFSFTRCIKHWSVASKNSEKFNISPEVKSIIDSHMYPLMARKIKRPKWKNFWVVTMADKFAATYEYFYAISHLNFNYKKIKMKKTKNILNTLEEKIPLFRYIDEKIHHKK